MPRNGSGTYLPPQNSWNPAINGALASPDDWMSILNDMVTALTASASADGQTPITGVWNFQNNRISGVGVPIGEGDALRLQQLMKGSDVASATNIAFPIEGAFFEITGTTTIATISPAFSGRAVLVRFADALTLTNSSDLALPGGANIQTQAGDFAAFICVDGLKWVCWLYPRRTESFPVAGVSAIAAGTADARTATLSPALTAYADQSFYVIRIPDGNDADDPTLDLGPGAKTVVKNSNQPLYPGDMDGTCLFQYDAALDKLVLLNPADQTDFTIIYPNGGSAGSPANVAINTRYVETNPFPGHYVICQPEIQLVGRWFVPGWATAAATTQAWGVSAASDGTELVVQTGITGLSTGNSVAGGTRPSSIPGDQTTPCPCRVKVWKVKGAI